MANAILSATRLRELFSYCPESGVFTRIVGVKGNGSRVGSVAGSLTDRGYLNIKVDGRQYRAHRLAWLYFYGHWPEHEIDHINCIKTDNRIVNLRDVTPSQNQQNSGKQANNKSGFKGVYYNKLRQKWKAQIGHSCGAVTHLGLFETAEQASVAYRAAAAKFHTHNPQAI